jgi:hypothetical protein
MTPPPELVEELQDLGNLDAIQLAYQAGADQELEACCELLRQFGLNETSLKLQRIRRPKPPSLKEQALKTVDKMSFCISAGFVPMRRDLDTIRKALKALPND